MKKIICNLTAAIIVFSTGYTFAQGRLDAAKAHFDVPGGVQNVDKKVLKDPDPQILPYIALKFRTGTKGSASVGKKDNKTTSVVYAVLDGIDSTIFQEITNEFYEIFTSKMKEAGVTYLDFAKVSASKSYTKFSEKQSNRNYDHKDNGNAHIFTQNNVPFFEYPTLITKVGKLQSETGGALTTLRLTLDFAEFDISMSKSYGWNYVTTNANANVLPVIKITHDFQEGTADAATTGSYFNAGGLALSNNKLFSAVFQMKKPIYAPFEANIDAYDDKLPKFANKKMRFFGGGAGMKLGTFVVTPTPEDFKKAALNALSEYADLVIEIIKSYNVK